MPIYDYKCRECGAEFEALVRKNDTPHCATCKSVDLERRFPHPYVKSEITKEKGLRAAKKRDQAQATDRVQEQIRYEKSHND